MAKPAARGIGRTRCLPEIGGNPERGLDPAEVEKRRAKFGPNQLQEASPPPMWRRFLGQFLEPMVAILITAAVVSGLMGDVIDTLAILAIVLLNGVIGFIQEERAERALSALQRLSAPLAKVFREGAAPVGTGPRTRARRPDRPGGR